jgi:Transposase domain (DUF772)
VRERLKDSYSETGRPSIDPELLLRILLIGYWHGITSERKLVEVAQVHHTVRQYLKELEQQNPVEEPVHEQDQVSTTDPIPLTPRKGARRPGWVITTIISWTIKAA